ncbi:MAG: class I SAM-dependent methyltransferase [Bacteroidota bacterium]
MNLSLLQQAPQAYITGHWNTDIHSLLLRKPLFEGITQIELAQQLESKKKCHSKLPLWFHTPQIYYPPKQSIEQSSSEATAQYKAGLVSGNNLLDLTGGFGVDSYYMSKQFQQGVHCEFNSELSQIAEHNFKVLGATNLQCNAIDGLQFLEDSRINFDTIYLDPSRRDAQRGRVFLLEDCVPQLPLHLDALFRNCNTVLLKTAPLLDLSKGIAQLSGVQAIHIVAVNNEVKELLWLLQKGYDGPISLIAAHLHTNKAATDIFTFKREEETDVVSHFDEPQAFLYEPNTAILKAGAFKLVGQRYGVRKLHPHSHLYTSDTLVAFPGRRFKVERVWPYHKKTLKKLGIAQANVSCRNFPESVATLRKKLGLKDGGATYLFFTTDKANQKIMVQCTKVPKDRAT